MRKILLSLLALSLFCASTAPTMRTPAESLSKSDHKKYEKLLIDSLKFFNTELRDAHSGQYYDAISLVAGEEKDYNSSVAATGMGLVSLALGDAIGVIPNARNKSIRSLEFALGHGPSYLSKRSKTGWFRHWFDARSGADNDASRGDGYSTIDTAILVAGAQIAANYFSATNQDTDGELRRLADRILFSVDWDSSIADLELGRLYLNYDLSSERPKAWTAVFSEYLVVACVGRYSDLKRGRTGKITEFWNRHYASPAQLPKKSYEGIELLTDSPAHFLSSFTIQFASYLCSDVSRSEEYLDFVSKAAIADRLWFSKQTDQEYLWGLGAGEVRYRENGEIQKSYAANALEDNPHRIASPHIIAGFLPVYSDGMRDLLTLYTNKECLYSYHGYDLLWRCSLDDLSLPHDRLQAVDFSSMILGLSSFHPAVGGWDFFRKYAP